VITTRLPVADLVDYERTSVQRFELEQLSGEAGAQLLRALSVIGDEEKLRSASDEFGGHPYVSVDHSKKNGVRAPNIIFSGANIYIVSGSGTTNDNGNPTGLGNLIIGYDETPSFSPFDRSGSHKLVMDAIISSPERLLAALSQAR
jgi:hypothetical protein